MVQCSKCGRDLDHKNKEELIASISGSIMGDEDIDSYYYCAQCSVYTVEMYHDSFTGSESVSVRGPVSKTEGDEAVALIRQCSRPWEKKCRCEAHCTYFRGALD